MLNSTDIDTLVRENQEKIRTLYYVIKDTNPEILNSEVPWVNALFLRYENIIDMKFDKSEQSLVSLDPLTGSNAVIASDGQIYMQQEVINLYQRGMKSPYNPSVPIQPFSFGDNDHIISIPILQWQEAVIAKLEEICPLQFKIEKNGKIIDALYGEIRKLDPSYKIEINMPPDLTEEAQLTWQKETIDILEKKSQSFLPDCIRKANRIRELRDSIYFLDPVRYSEIQNKPEYSYEQILSQLLSEKPPIEYLGHEKYSISNIERYLTEANEKSFSKLFSNYGAQFILLHSQCSEQVIESLKSIETVLLREKFEANKKEIEDLIAKFGYTPVGYDKFIPLDEISIEHIRQQKNFISEFNQCIDKIIHENNERIMNLLVNIKELDEKKYRYFLLIKLNAPINGGNTSEKKALLNWQENFMGTLKEVEDEYKAKIAENKEKISALQSALGVSCSDNNSGPSQVSSGEYIRQQERAIKELENILYRYCQNNMGLKKLNSEKNNLQPSDKIRHRIYEEMIEDVNCEQSRLQQKYPNIQNYYEQNAMSQEDLSKIEKSFLLNDNIIKTYIMLSIRIENLENNNGEPEEIKKLVNLKKELLDNPDYFCLSGYVKLERIPLKKEANPPLNACKNSSFSSSSSFFSSIGSWFDDKFKTPKSVAPQPNDSIDDILADLMAVSHLENVSRISTDIQKSAEILSRSVKIAAPSKKPQKISVIGDRQTGKTCLVLKITENHYTDDFIPHMKEKYKFKKVVACGNSVGINIWDVCGKENFSNITDSFHQASNIVICFDVTNRQSFENIQNWYNEIVQFDSESLGKKLVLVGNKCDLVAERVVFYDEAYALAKKLGMLYIETSAKFGLNIENVTAAFALAPHITSSFSEPVFWQKREVSNSHSSSSSSSGSSSSSSRSMGSLRS